MHPLFANDPQRPLLAYIREVGGGTRKYKEKTNLKLFFSHTTKAWSNIKWEKNSELLKSDQCDVLFIMNNSFYLKL